MRWSCLPCWRGQFLVLLQQLELGLTSFRYLSFVLAWKVLSSIHLVIITSLQWCFNMFPVPPSKHKCKLALLNSKNHLKSWTIMQAFFLAMSENFLIEQVSWKQGSQLNLEDGFSIFTKWNMNKKKKENTRMRLHFYI